MGTDSAGKLFLFSCRVKRGKAWYNKNRLVGRTTKSDTNAWVISTRFFSLAPLSPHDSRWGSANQRFHERT